MSETIQLTAFPGINSNSLGHYLMGLGLLRAISSRWPEGRGCWHDGIFFLAGPFAQEEVSGFLKTEWEPTPYEKWWSAEQKADTKAKTSTRIWAARSTQTVRQVRVSDATIVPAARNQFNPLFGTGGNVGKRNMESAWREAATLKGKPESGPWLESSLLGKQTTELPSFTNGGTWFVYDNKTFNSGLEWYREGYLSPWSFLLAMEGALLLRGGSGRRLGARARPYAVFPFVSQPLNPVASTDVGQKLVGEFWAPIWEQPATLGEVRFLFQRGLARIGGRAAVAPHEFAVAALAAGADSGVTQFIRFELRQTTSRQVFEALPRQKFAVQQNVGITNNGQTATLLEPFLGKHWFDMLPQEPARSDSKLRFSGLRGSLERLILEVAHDPDNPESWRKLWLQLAKAQGKIDRNSNLRGRCRALPLLPWRWLQKAFPGTPATEVRVAAALAALGAGTDYPAQSNVFGIEFRAKQPVFQKPGRPARAVWHDGDAQLALLDIVQRRLTDSGNDSLSPLRSHLHLSPSDISQYLTADSGSLKIIQNWLPALTLLNWIKAPMFFEKIDDVPEHQPELLVWALFKPFFFSEELRINSDRKFFRQGSSARPALSRQLFHHLRRSAWKEAINLAVSGYLAEGWRVVSPVDPGSSFDAARIASALALPISASDLASLVFRWLEPSKENKKSRENNEQSYRHNTELY